MTEHAAGESNASPHDPQSDPAPKPSFSPSAWFRAIRPKQWLKNLLLFSGVFLNLHLYWREIALWRDAAAGFLIFCLLSGSVYLVNDLLDVEQDRLHPKKKKRPIAAGEISIGAARGYAFGLMAVALGGAWFLGGRFFACSALYWCMVMSYSVKLKHIAIVDILTLAAGFVLRALGGIFAIREDAISIFGVEPRLTAWFLLCTLFLALFIAVCKRRSELEQLGDESVNTRAVLKEYPLRLLDDLIAISATCCLMTYALYCVLEHREMLLLTLPFVIFGIARYLMHLRRDNEGGAPEQIVLKDPALIANVLLWMATLAAILLTQQWPR